jgi:hypothetical protein
VPDAGSIDHVTSFGEDGRGEVHVVDQDGEIFRIERACAVPAACGAAFCNAADGARAHCPCGDAGAPAAGCETAAATGGVEARVLAQASELRRATLAGLGFPAAQQPTALVLRAERLDPTGPAVFGDGVRCLATALVRLGATSARGGVSTHAIGHGAGAGLFRYQIWFRDLPASACDPLAASNLSSGVALVW